ncbi:DNA recombination/repair protein RecA, partial [bacterium]|nr:DNA recombination/repair protein RecA [candidate division CSSED10-310 bacterium]
PFRKAEFDIIYGQGISKSGTLLDMGVNYQVVSKSGVWFSLGDTRLGQGRENAKRFLDEHPEVLEDLYQKILEAGKFEFHRTHKASGETGETAG